MWHQDMVKVKLLLKGANVDVVNIYGYSSLMWASIHDSYEILKGANVNAKKINMDKVL